LDNDINKELEKLGLAGSLAIFLPAALLMYVLTRFLIPYLSRVTGQEPILFWFIVGGAGIFTPLIVTGLLILHREGYAISRQTITERLRFRRLTKRDIVWSIIGLVAVGIVSGVIMQGIKLITGAYDPSPEFMAFEPLSRGRYWLLLVWLPYWILNILGEEFLWRGVLFPRQEVAFGKCTWLVHGCGWGVFHIAFGWQLLLTLLPLLFIQSYIVQKTKNSWVGVILHGGLNGPSFLAICFGLI